MPLDATKIGQVVAEQMEALEARFGDDCQIGDVCTIVEVLGPHGSQVAVRPGSDVRPHGLIGLLRMAETMALSGVRGEPAEGD
jgi:acetyltransferase-like isoleucine patch superfamily enzyme